MEEEGDRDSRGELRNIYFLEKREGGFTERNECSLRPVKYLEIPIITEDVVQLKQIGFHLYLTSKSTCFFTSEHSLSARQQREDSGSVRFGC